MPQIPPASPWPLSPRPQLASVQKRCRTCGDGAETCRLGIWRCSVDQPANLAKTLGHRTGEMEAVDIYVTEYNPGRAVHPVPLLQQQNLISLWLPATLEGTSASGPEPAEPRPPAGAWHWAVLGLPIGYVPNCSRLLGFDLCSGKLQHASAVTRVPAARPYAAGRRRCSE